MTSAEERPNDSVAPLHGARPSHSPISAFTGGRWTIDRTALHGSTVFLA
jgi:hypothetical protein